LVGDVSHQADVEGWVERVAPLELLVNNAGIGSNASFDSDLDDFRRTIDVNVLGVYMCTRLFLPGMRAAGRGRIVTLSSSAAFMPNPPGELSIAYCCSKAAAARLTEIVADREHAHGVRAFAVSPGGVVTGLSERLGLRFDDPTPPSRVSDLIIRIAAGDLDHLNGRYLHANDDITELIDRGPQIVEDDLHAIRLLT
jgi:NAD(P)-dependent dehydrogenase (short-subunit alcohol dehydrogenase family)